MEHSSMVNSKKYIDISGNDLTVFLKYCVAFGNELIKEIYNYLIITSKKSHYAVCDVSNGGLHK